MKLPKSRDLRRILVAQLPADFADWLDYVAIISLFTFTWSVEPVYFAFFALAFSLPYLVVGPFSGALVDRYDLKTVMVWSNFGRALTTFALVFAGQPEIVLVLVFLRGCIDSFYSPAKQSAIQTLAEKSELMATNSLSQVLNQASKLVGPAVGGALLLFMNAQAVFVVNGCISLLALAILLGLPKALRSTAGKSEEKQDDKKKQSIFIEIADGYKTIGRIPALWASIGLGAFGFFAIFLHDTLIGPITKLLGFDQSVLGLTITAVGAGGVLGALAMGSVKRALHPFSLIGPGMIVAALLTLLLGSAATFLWAFPIWIFVPGAFVIGFASSAIFVPMRTILQLETPPDKMGRVAAANEAVTVVAMMSAPFIGALLATNYGLGVPFLVGGGLSLLVGFGAIAMVPLIKFKTAEDQPDEAGSTVAA